MSAQESYDRLLPTLLAYPKGKLQKPNVPVEELLGETEKTSVVIKEGRDILVNAGLNPEYIDNFDDRIGAYAIAAAKYVVLMDGNGGYGKDLNDLEGPAHDLRREIMHNFRFAFRNNSEALKSLERISKGRSRKDMIFDFVSLIELAENYPEELDAINFDRGLLDQARESYENLKNLVAKITVSPKQISEVKDIRDRAYTYLNEALTAIKEHSQFVFWKDEAKLALYKRDYSNYRRHSNGDSNDETVDTNANDVIAN